MMLGCVWDNLEINFLLATICNLLTCSTFISVPRVCFFFLVQTKVCVCNTCFSRKLKQKVHLRGFKRIISCNFHLRNFICNFTSLEEDLDTIVSTLCCHHFFFFFPFPFNFLLVFVSSTKHNSVRLYYTIPLRHF